MPPRPPRSTLFPYTTLFRSTKWRTMYRTPREAVDRRSQVQNALRRHVGGARKSIRSEEHTSELQSHHDLVCRLLLEKKKKKERKTNLTKANTKHQHNHIRHE